jgi:hypothetical protein
VEVPEVRYARNGDVNIAFQVVGSGPVDLLYIPGWISHLDLWRDPARLKGIPGVRRLHALVSM